VALKTTLLTARSPEDFKSSHLGFGHKSAMIRLLMSHRVSISIAYNKKERPCVNNMVFLRVSDLLGKGGEPNFKDFNQGSL